MRRRRIATIPPQQGAALVVGLIFLVMLTLLGVTAFGLSTLEERMSGHTRDHTLAFQAAEAALRHCENEIEINNIAAMTSSQAARWQPIRPRDNAERATWDLAWGNDGQGGDSIAVAVGCPDVNNKDCITGVAAQPRCIVEEMGQRVSCGKLGLPTPGYEVTDAMLYRVTARGYGLSPGTLVVLQSVVFFCLGGAG